MLLPVIILILLVFAFVFEVLAACGIPSPPRFNLMAAGLACFILAYMLATVPGRM